MSRPVVLLVDRSEVRVLRSAAVSGGAADADADAAAAASVAWNPDASVGEMTRALAPLQATTRVRAGLVVVIGLGLLDIAQPELPPVSNAARHALLLRDADRYFPIEGPAAVALSYPFALAAPSERFGAWMQAIATIGRLRAVITIADALVRAGTNGSWTVAAGAGESAYVTIEGGALRDLRRHRQTAGETPPRAPVPLAHVARGAAAALGAPLDTMLLDHALASRLTAGRRWQSTQRAAAALLLAGGLAWSADRWHAHQLTRADAELARLTNSAAPAQTSALRLQRARAELDLLKPQTSASAADVLARLGAVLPRDAFVQRLDWDGSVWRIDGSAANAPAIVPVLDGDAMFSDVRIVSATTRFMDMGRQRESFSISFQTRDAGGANGTP